MEEAAGRVPVLAGAAATTPPKSSRLAQELEAMGVDGILSVTPYYNKPTQEGLYQHYKAIAEAVSLPIVLYNVQGRTGVISSRPRCGGWREIENIVGVKEASGNIAQIGADPARRRRSDSRCFRATMRWRCRHRARRRAA